MNTNIYKKIVIIEPDEQVRYMTGVLLQVEGYENIAPFENIKAYAEHCKLFGRQQDDALIICSMGYPSATQKTSGLEFLEQLRENGNDVPFILFTGIPVTEEESVRIVALGNAAYLEKGCSREALVGFVRNMLDPVDPIFRAHNDPGPHTPEL